MSLVKLRGSKLPSIKPEIEEPVLRMVFEGMTNPDIAVVMGTTEHMVKNYLRLIYDKIGLSNRVELALWYAAKHPELL